MGLKSSPKTRIWQPFDPSIHRRCVITSTMTCQGAFDSREGLAGDTCAQSQVLKLGDHGVDGHPSCQLFCRPFRRKHSAREWRIFNLPPKTSQAYKDILTDIERMGRPLSPWLSWAKGNRCHAWTTWYSSKKDSSSKATQKMNRFIKFTTTGKKKTVAINFDGRCMKMRFELAGMLALPFGYHSAPARHIVTKLHKVRSLQLLGFQAWLGAWSPAWLP